MASRPFHFRGHGLHILPDPDLKKGRDVRTRRSVACATAGSWVPEHVASRSVEGWNETESSGLRLQGSIGSRHVSWNHQLSSGSVHTQLRRHGVDNPPEENLSHYYPRYPTVLSWYMPS